MNIGERIRFLREAKKLSQVEMAKRIAVSKQTLYKYENGIISNIPSDKIEAIALICDVSPCFIMGWEKNDSSISLFLNDHEKQLITEYRKQPEIQTAVDRLLGIGNASLKMVQKDETKLIAHGGNKNTKPVKHPEKLADLKRKIDEQE